MSDVLAGVPRRATPDALRSGAIAVLGWPVEKLAPEVAGQVVEGGRRACADAGLPLAGGHSIDAPEPIFGLAVTGRVTLAHAKRNSSAAAGCGLWLTKPLGVGILTTAERRRLLRDEHRGLALASMTTLDRVGPGSDRSTRSRP